MESIMEALVTIKLIEGVAVLKMGEPVDQAVIIAATVKIQINLPRQWTKWKQQRDKRAV